MATSRRAGHISDEHPVHFRFDGRDYWQPIYPAPLDLRRFVVFRKRFVTRDRVPKSEVPDAGRIRP
jgi:hypothetical protein